MAGERGHDGTVGVEESPDAASRPVARRHVLLRNDDDVAHVLELAVIVGGRRRLERRHLPARSSDVLTLDTDGPFRVEVSADQGSTATVGFGEEGGPEDATASALVVQADTVVVVRYRYSS